MTDRIAVIGAGSYGTALAIQLARRGAHTWLWGRDPHAMEQLQRERENARYLPGCRFPDTLEATSDISLALTDIEDLLIVVPSHALRETLERVKPLLRAEHGIASACKGLEPGTGKLVHEVFADVLGDSHELAIVSGPTFAKELAKGAPTAVTVASAHDPFAERMALALHGDGFRAYVSNDIVGVEVGGSVKNVLAIAVGIADGLGLGANARAALITRGLAEIMRLGSALGAQVETLMGLAGLGDLVLTCTDDQSRNRRMGLLLARGHSVDAAVAEIRQVVEGVRVAPEVLARAHSLGIEMPITEQVCKVLSGETSPLQAVQALANRPAKNELDGTPLGD